MSNLFIAAGVVLLGIWIVQTALVLVRYRACNREQDAPTAKQTL